MKELLHILYSTSVSRTHCVDEELILSQRKEGESKCINISVRLIYIYKERERERERKKSKRKKKKGKKAETEMTKSYMKLSRISIKKLQP